MAAWLLATVWCLLLCGAALVPVVGAETARLCAYAASAALLLWLRPPGRIAAPPLALGLASAAGFVALPAWLAFVWWLGTGLGLAPLRMLPAVGRSATDWLAHVALAPVFEELLHRGWLLAALRRRVGAPLALALSSAAFAAPHLEPWSVLTTFCFGIALGGVQLASGRVGLCVACHAGANAAVLVCGLPPARAALEPGAAAGTAVALLALALAWPPGRGARTRLHATRAGATAPHAAEARGLQ